jgi:type VI secretion system VasD/TssJ family lipoprotein
MLAKFKRRPAWLLGLLWAACGHAPAPCPGPESIPVILRAGDRLNVGDGGQALPTTVRLYQLKDVGRLASATLEQMLENDRATLAGDLLSVREITLYPGEAAKPLLDRREGADFLAVVAFFHHPAGNGWRAVSKLPPVDAAHCHAQADGRPWFRFALLENQINANGGTR